MDSNMNKKSPGVAFPAEKLEALDEASKQVEKIALLLQQANERFKEAEREQEALRKSLQEAMTTLGKAMAEVMRG